MSGRMIDLWEEEKGRTMWVTGDTTGDDVMDFLVPGAAPQALSKRKAGDNTMSERLEDDEGIG